MEQFVRATPSLRSDEGQLKADDLAAMYTSYAAPLRDIKVETSPVKASSRTESGPAVQCRTSKSTEMTADKLQFTPISDGELSILDSDRGTSVKASLATKHVHTSLTGALHIARPADDQDVSVQIFLRVCKLDLPVDGTFRITTMALADPSNAMDDYDDTDDTSEACTVDLGVHMDHQDMQTLPESGAPPPADDLQQTLDGMMANTLPVASGLPPGTTQDTPVSEEDFLLHKLIKDEPDGSDYDSITNCHIPGPREISLGVVNDTLSNGSPLGENGNMTPAVCSPQMDLDNPAVLNKDKNTRKTRSWSQKHTCASTSIGAGGNADKEQFSLAKHMKSNPRMAMQPQTFRCNHCKMCFSKKESYYHLKSAHCIATPYACEKCDYEADGMCKLLRHIKGADFVKGTAPEEIQFTCEVCHMVFDYLCEIKRHRLTHSTIPGTREIFRCKLCGKIYMAMPTFVDHMHERHAEQMNATTLEDVERIPFSGQKYNCPRCPYSVGDKQCLEDHMNSQHECKNPYLCEVCGASFSTFKSLKNHHRSDEVHRTASERSCTICGKKFTYKNNLEKHIKSHGEKHVCNLCNYVAPSSWRLNSHTRSVHLGERRDRKFPCSSCEYSARNPFNLKIHMRTHGVGRDQKYPCDTCGAQLSSALSLHRHKRQHEGASVQKHVCTVCGKSFMQKCTLDRHMDVHSGVKRYKCDVCDMAFSQSFPLTKHLKKHHPEHFDHLVATGKYKGQRAMLGRTRD